MFMSAAFGSAAHMAAASSSWHAPAAAIVLSGQCKGVPVADF